VRVAAAGCIVVGAAVVALAACWVPCRFVDDATGDDLGEPWRWMWIWDSPANGWEVWRLTGIESVELPDGTWADVMEEPSGHLAVAWGLVAGEVAAALATALAALGVLWRHHRRRLHAAR
jgi:hypothetical protein